jgi:hypothetical protein
MKMRIEQAATFIMLHKHEAGLPITGQTVTEAMQILCDREVPVSSCRFRPLPEGRLYIDALEDFLGMLTATGIVGEDEKNNIVLTEKSLLCFRRWLLDMLRDPDIRPQIIQASEALGMTTEKLIGIAVASPAATA